MKRNFKGQKSSFMFSFSPSKKSLRISFNSISRSSQQQKSSTWTFSSYHVKLTETKLQAEYAAPIMAAELPNILRCVLVDTK